MNRGARRDGFAHHHAVDKHAPMGVHHLQAQLMLARWLREKYPDAEVELEATTEDGRRRADVMLISPTGRRAAFEVQYAALTPRQWQARHDDYVRDGILDIWLWGHVPPHLRRVRGADETVAPTPVMQTLAEQGHPLLWINPDAEQLGVAVRQAWSPDAEHYLSLRVREQANLVVLPLDVCRLDGALGFTCRFIDQVRRAEQLAHALEAAAAAREQKRIFDEAESARNVIGFLKRVAAKAAARLEPWRAQPERAAVLAAYGGDWPTFLNVQVDGYSERAGGRIQIQMPWEPEHWEGLLYARFIHEKPSGTRVTLKAMAQTLEAADSDVRYAYEAVQSWSRELVAHRVLRREAFERAGGEQGIRYVVGDLEQVAKNPRYRRGLSDSFGRHRRESSSALSMPDDL
nr:competence protein CoiA family protein [Agromyces seonyuensis]